MSNLSRHPKLKAGVEMLVQTTRFGTVEIAEVDKLTFPEGLLGFAGLSNFVLLDDPQDEIFVWLQSCDNPGIAFPVLEPELFFTSYQVQLAKTDLQGLDLSANDTFRVFTIITIPDDPTLMTANMKAPVVVNLKNRIARQCVLQDNSLQIREPIFTALQQRLMTNPTGSIRSHARDMGVAIPVQKPTVKDPEAHS